MKTKERKDRIYILKSKATPLSYMLKTRNSRRSPLMYFDEDKAINRALRYSPNQKSPFEDDQDDNVIVEPVVFEDGFLRVTKNNTVLQWFLSIHPGLGKEFEELNTEKDASKDVEIMDIKLDAAVAARELSLDMTESIARILLGTTADSMSTAEIKRDVRIYADQYPLEFLEMIDNPELEVKDLTQQLISKGLLSLRNSNRDVYFNLKNNKKRMLTVPFGEDPKSAVAAYFKSNEGIEVMEMLEKALNI
tara:strand:- start:178 stop:924 length:747 start_codon:yes stop_codon:yes gene_type:complete